MSCRTNTLSIGNRVGQSGVGLVEAIIGLFILTIILLSGAQLFRVHVEHLALVERARRADEQAHNTMNALAAQNYSLLPDSNPFNSMKASASHKPIVIASHESRTHPILALIS